jgi:hypothetical protein
MEANTFHQQEVGAVLWHLYHKTSGREFALEDQLVLFWHHCADQAEHCGILGERFQQEDKR